MNKIVVIGYEYLMKNECSDECICKKLWLHIEPISDKHGIVRKIDVCNECFDEETRFNLWKDYLNETVTNSLNVSWEEAGELKHDMLGKTILDNHSRCGDEYICSFPLTKQQLESYGITMPESMYQPLYGGDLYYKSKGLLDIYNYFENYCELDPVEKIIQDYLVGSQMLQFLENNCETNNRVYLQTSLNIGKLMELTEKSEDEVMAILNKSNLSEKLNHYIRLLYDTRPLKFIKPYSYQNPNFIWVQIN